MKKDSVHHRYDDIIHLPHHVSLTRPQMPLIDRAAQFSPFAALTGYEAAINETARLTKERIELDETGKAALNGKLLFLKERLNEYLHEQPEISITYFRPDEKKSGGAYVTATGPVKKIDEYERIVVMADQTVIPIEQVCEITGQLFAGTEFSDLI